MCTPNPPNHDIECSGKNIKIIVASPSSLPHIYDVNAWHLCSVYMWHLTHAWHRCSVWHLTHVWHFCCFMWNLTHAWHVTIQDTWSRSPLYGQIDPVLVPYFNILNSFLYFVNCIIVSFHRSCLNEWHRKRGLFNKEKQ